MGHITLGAKRAGERSAGNLHAPFDEAGAGDGLTVELVRHSQRKRGATDRLHLRSTAPAPDPTVLPARGVSTPLDCMRRASGTVSGIAARNAGESRKVRRNMSASLNHKPQDASTG